MILNALVDYYERIVNDPEQKGVARYGFSPRSITSCIVLGLDGSVCSVDDLRFPDENGKERAHEMLVPYPGGKRTSDIKPYFLWDKPGYVLGRTTDNPKSTPGLSKRFQEFKDFHLALQAEINDPAYDSLCLFLKDWDPTGDNALPNNDLVLSGSIVFRITNTHAFLHDIQSCRDAWVESLASEDTAMGICLVTNLQCGIARTHAPIKGVIDPGGQVEKALISFNTNKPAFSSYGKTQCLNAPVGIEIAFRYCTALNRLLADRDRRVRIGDATVVWWSDTPTPMESFFGAVLDDTSAEDEVTKLRVGAFLNRLRRGIVGDDLGDLDQPFYVLGLSPNASRLSVRFWLVGTVGRFAERLAQHHADLALGNWNTPDNGMTLSNLIMETARDRKDPKTVSPRLAGEVTRSILLGLPYPASLAEGVLRRIRAEGNITSRQASILKASIIRKGYDMQPHLDPTYDSAAYQCGRLFATLNYAQQIASPTVKGSMAARYLRAVMATPGLLLGRLEGLCEVGHLRKIDSDDIQTFFRDELANINAQLTPPLPKHLQGIDQSMFMLGYYKQLQWIQRVVARRGKDRPFIHRYRTARGDWVRSKLERRVIDTLHRFGIAYVYEPIRVIGDGIPRRPDLLINGATKRLDVYIEVAGGWKDMEAYNTRHESKLREYEEAGITETGEDHGFLRVLDFRDVDMTKRGWYDEKRHVIDKISDVVNLQSDSRGTEEN